MGGLAMGEWENRQRKSYNIETNCIHSKGGYGRQPLGAMFTHVMDCLKERASLKKPIP
jgi:hypothetical protein